MAPMGLCACTFVLDLEIDSGTQDWPNRTLKYVSSRWAWNADGSGWSAVIDVPNRANREEPSPENTQGAFQNDLKDGIWKRPG